MEISWKPVKTHDRWSIDGSFLERVIILELFPHGSRKHQKVSVATNELMQGMQAKLQSSPQGMSIFIGKIHGKIMGNRFYSWMDWGGEYFRKMIRI